MARPFLALGGMALIGIGLATAFGWGWGSSYDTTTPLANAIHGVRLNGDSGSVKIRVGSDASIHQHLRWHWRGKPGDAFHMEGDQLVLDDCGNNCSASFELTLPAAVPVVGHVDSGGLDIAGMSSVDVQTDSGAAKIENVAGPVKLRHDSGSIELHDVGDVELRSDSGSIHADGVRGSVDVTSSSGSVRFELARENDVKVHADSGSVEVTVPGGPYRVLGNTDSGHRQIDVQTSDSAAHALDLTTDSGSVTVHAA
ncbi:MAG TPA: DUF4097 family beta strand repeat-containing protein [Amycolatopsis sp.]|nr:DUF4097 family beta strand repeat-containing protein [Amycolatopsis sp.]